MKYKVGDKVRITKRLTVGGAGDMPELVGQTVVVTKTNDKWFDFKAANGEEETVFREDYDKVELINKGATMRRTFKLLKDTDGIRKGALFQEMCDDSDQDYVLLDNAFRRFEYPHSAVRCVRSRDAIENNPKWYVEVFPMVSEYGTKEEVNAFKKFLGKR